MTVRTYAELISDIALLTDNISNLNTPGILRGVLTNIADSMNVVASGENSGILATAITASKTLTRDDNTLLLNGTGAAFNQVLPSPTGNTGRVLGFIKTDASANAVGFSGHINGTAASTITRTSQLQGYVLKCDGTTWRTISAF